MNPHSVAANPLLTEDVNAALLRAAQSAPSSVECTLDLGRTRTHVAVDQEGWSWNAQRFTFIANCKPRTIYHWERDRFQPVSRYSGSLIKLVPTEWGPPTFEIDGIKMLPTAQRSPLEDAKLKVALVEPHGKSILDSCGGLGYFAACCLERDVIRIESFEKNADVIWLRSLNPWSPEQMFAHDARLALHHADITQSIEQLESNSFDAVLHDPPRFGIAGELYSQTFYHQLARVLKRRGVMFHYTGAPNKLSSGRDLPNEVAARLRKAGFRTQLQLDGVFAIKSIRQ